MKLIKNIAYIMLGGLIMLSCSEDETFKDLNTQVFIYPIEEIEDGVIDRLTELAYDEDTTEREVTVRIAIYPPQPTPTTVSYEFLTIDDPDVVSAVEGVDYEVLSDKTVTIPANQDFVDVTFKVLNDLEIEPDEEFIFYLTDAGDRTLLEGSRQYRFTIRESDQPTTVSVNNATFVEGDTYDYSVGLSNKLETEITVNYTVGGSATSGSDFTPLSGSITIPAYSSEGTIQVELENNDGLEWDETIDITLTSVVGNGVVSDDDDEATITIKDNSLNPVVNDLAFALVWEDPTTANLELTLWTLSGSDTVEVSASNNPADFESLVLAEAQPNGTYYVTASWVDGTADEADFAAYIGTNGYNQSERIEDTIEPTNTKADDPIFLYTINKADTYDVNEE